MNSNERDDGATEVFHRSPSEVNASAMQEIYDGAPYVLIAGSNIDFEGHHAVSIKLGNGVSTLVEARDLLLAVVDQLDLAMLEYGEEG